MLPSADIWGCLLSYNLAEPGWELMQPSPRLLAEPSPSIYSQASTWWSIWGKTPGGWFQQIDMAPLGGQAWNQPPGDYSNQPQVSIIGHQGGYSNQPPGVAPWPNFHNERGALKFLSNFYYTPYATPSCDSSILYKLLFLHHIACHLAEVSLAHHSLAPRGCSHVKLLKSATRSLSPNWPTRGARE